MSAAGDWSTVTGYADRLSARPGERLQVMVSCSGDLEAQTTRLPDGPSPIAVNRVGEPGVQPVRTGSRVEAPHHPALRPGDGLLVSAWVWLAPGAPGGRRQALMASWGPGGEDGWALVLDREGRPRFEVAAGGQAEEVMAGAAVPRDAWWQLEGALDPDSRELSITRRDRSGGVVETVRASVRLSRPGDAPGPLMLGAEQREVQLASSHLDGKLESPTVASGPGGERLVATWELGGGRSPEVPDRGPLGLAGRCVNGPLRAVTGRGWNGDVHDWRFASEGYEAMHFHSDAIDDLAWEPTLELEIGDDCPSGMYAVVLRSSGCEDVIPFCVRRAAGAEPAAHAVLLPTFTYLAYSCERAAPAAAGSARHEDRWVARNRLRSLYDRFDDGCGVYEASILRPLTQLRPGYACPQHGGPHGLAQDLGLLAFLGRRGIAADLLTDHDLHAEGAGALAGHRVVITGAHPEYASTELLDALEAHVDAGGSLAYLGGNGLNGPVSVDPERPHVAELRSSETQGLAWQALPGEHHHAATGAYGGDWRRRGRPEHRFLGVGLSAFGDAPAASYEPVVDRHHPAGRIAFEGLDPRAPIGHPGRVLGGAAGFEVDNFDPLLGSPADAIRLASADVGPSYEVWPDDVRDGPHAAPKRRADMVLRLIEEGGTVFSVGSIAWTGCIDGDDANPVARVTENVLRELASETPFEAARG